MRLSSAPYRGTVVAGGWWPRSADPVAEFPGLVLALDEAHGRVHGLRLGAHGWKDRPTLLEVAGRAIRLSWSQEMPKDLLIAVADTGALTRLLVVPPGIDAFTAWSALDLAAMTANIAEPSEIMDTAGRLPPRARTPAESEWESEGGHLYEEGRAGRPGRNTGDRVSVRREQAGPGRMLVRVSGDLDAAQAPACRVPLFAAIRPDSGAVVVDLSGVTFFGAAGASLMAAARTRAERLGVELRIASPPRSVRTVLDIIGTRDLPPVHPTVEEALADTHR